jgi:outer membrane protein TolC
LLALNAKTKPAIARLNASLNRPSHADIVPPSEIPGESLALSDSELLARATQINPALRAFDLSVQRENSAVNLAKRKFYPNFTFGIDYLKTGEARMPGTRDSGKDPVIGRFSINIPIWRGAYSAGQREAEARRRAAQLERRDHENHLLARMQAVLFDFHDAERKISLYHDALIPKAQQSISASMQGYEAGEVDFLDLLDAQQMFLEFVLAEQRARADRLIHLAELRMLVGDAYNESSDAQRQR